MTINVLYDISILGIAHRNQNNFGIKRSTESLLLALLEMPDLAISASCDLSYQVWLYSRLYLEKNELQDTLPWLSNAPNLKIRNKLKELIFNDHRFNQLIETLQKYHLIKDQQTIDQLFHWRNQILEYKFKGTGVRDIKSINIYHSSYYEIPQQIKSKKIKSILTIHDLIPILHPQWCGMLGEKVKYFHPEFNLPHTLSTINPDTWLVCPSECTKNDLCNYLGDRLDPQKVYVTPWAASPAFYPCDDPDKIQEVKNKYKIPEGNYLLCLNTLEPRKNVDAVIRCFREAIKQEKINDLSLVLAGPLGWQYDAIIKEARRFPLLAPRIIFTGYVAEEDLAALYSGALVFIYPSF
jgi:glycosyltransferase involved in cell wall biosynthesis